MLILLKMKYINVPSDYNQLRSAFQGNSEAEDTEVWKEDVGS